MACVGTEASEGVERTANGPEGDHGRPRRALRSTARADAPGNGRRQGAAQLPRRVRRAAHPAQRVSTGDALRAVEVRRPAPRLREVPVHGMEEACRHPEEQQVNLLEASMPPARCFVLPLWRGSRGLVQIQYWCTINERKHALFRYALHSSRASVCERLWGAPSLPAKRSVMGKRRTHIYLSKITGAARDFHRSIQTETPTDRRRTLLEQSEAERKVGLTRAKK